MTESWAPEEMTEEQEAEFVKHNEEASEDDPPQLTTDTHIDKDDPPQTENRPPAERFSEETEQAAPVDGPEVKSTETTPAEEKEEKTPEAHPGDINADWFRGLPDEAKRHIQGLKGEASKARTARREDREEAERRFVQIAESNAEQIKKALSPQQVPDPDYDPEAYRNYQEARIQEYQERESKQSEDARVTADQQREFQVLDSSMKDQEFEFAEGNPDYWEAKQHAINSAAQKYTHQLGITEEKAKNLVMGEIFNMTQQSHKMGGNVAVQIYNLAHQQHAFKAHSTTDSFNGGENADAAAIQAGQASAKGLGRSGSGGRAGKLSIQEIAAIKDPEEHDLAYQEWVADQIGGQNWH